MTEVTHILSQIEEGDPSAAKQLLSLVYDELRHLAAAKLAREKPGQTLQATALVHEAYLRLVDVEKVQHWNSRGHFFAACGESMRRILVDQARRKRRPKHGGDLKRHGLDEANLVVEDRATEVLLVSDALDKLRDESPEKADLVTLRDFVGMSIPEAAKALGISLATANRHSTYAKVFPFSELRDTE